MFTRSFIFSDTDEEVNLAMMTETDNALLYLDYIELGFVSRPMCTRFRYFISGPRSATLTINFEIERMYMIYNF